MSAKPSALAAPCVATIQEADRCGRPVARPAAQSRASSIVATSTSAEVTSSARVMRPAAAGAASRRVSQPVIHMPAVSTAAPASCTQSPAKKPARTSAVPAGTARAASCPARRAGSRRQTRPATSAAVNPA
ncbi:hypothetical protein GCM10022255_077630 [Dactylosporangium darangshiense]|uniref:Uncharacterized protein n=1 Tax=Dactylosporangium darangshiense TaxID=579108 RepID=A0ABP8DKF9_9ACTN